MRIMGTQVIWIPTLTLSSRMSVRRCRRIFEIKQGARLCCYGMRHTMKVRYDSLNTHLKKFQLTKVSCFFKSNAIFKVLRSKYHFQIILQFFGVSDLAIRIYIFSTPEHQKPLIGCRDCLQTPKNTRLLFYQIILQKSGALPFPPRQWVSLDQITEPNLITPKPSMCYRASHTGAPGISCSHNSFNFLTVPRSKIMASLRIPE